MPAWASCVLACVLCSWPRLHSPSVLVQATTTDRLVARAAIASGVTPAKSCPLPTAPTPSASRTEPTRRDKARARRRTSSAAVAASRTTRSSTIAVALPTTRGRTASTGATTAPTRRADAPEPETGGAQLARDVGRELKRAGAITHTLFQRGVDELVALVCAQSLEGLGRHASAHGGPVRSDGSQ